jgi:anti-sigma B factor antagonist
LRPVVLVSWHSKASSLPWFPAACITSSGVARSTMTLGLLAERRPPWIVVHVVGDLDWVSRTTFDSCLARFLEEAEQPRIGVNVSRLQLCDSSGVAGLMRVWRTVTAKGGALILIRPRAELTRVLAWTGLDQKVQVADELPL